MRARVLGGIVAVLAVLLISSVAVAQYPGQAVGQGSSDIWVMNLDETLDAGVVASYVNQDGVSDSTVGGTIAPLGNTVFPASSSGLANDWLGSMVLFSDRELASVVELFWQNVPTGDGWSGASYVGYSEGFNDLFFPYVMMNPHQRSVVSIQCVDTVECEISMTYRGRDGVEATGNPFLDTIEPDSQESYDLYDPTLNPNIPTALPSGWFGAMRVTSDQKIAGVAVMHYRQGYAAAYNPFEPADDTEMSCPLVKRRNFGGLWRSQSDWTSIVVQNMATYPITIYHSYYNRTGGAPVLTFSDTIPALSSQGYNTRYGLDGQTPEIYDPLGQFIGSVVVTSTDPIVGTCTTVRYPSGGLAASHQGFPGGVGKLTFPRLYRTKNGPMWTGYSGVVVQNLDTGGDADVHVQFLNPDGSVAVEFDDTIPSYSSHGYNTRYDADVPTSTFNVLGDNWAGPVIVTTDNPVGVVAISQDEVAGTGYIYHMMYGGLSE